jgi:hypothetical protein
MGAYCVKIADNNYTITIKLGLISIYWGMIQEITFQIFLLCKTVFTQDIRNFLEIENY